MSSGLCAMVVDDRLRAGRAGKSKMRTGIRPKVNEAREFLEIAKDFKDPREIIREALSNSWDAEASKVSLRFRGPILLSVTPNFCQLPAI